MPLLDGNPKKMLSLFAEEEDGTIRTLMEVGGNRDQFIRVLDDHREECEKEGDYHEAKVPPRKSTQGN